MTKHVQLLVHLWKSRKRLKTFWHQLVRFMFIFSNVILNTHQIPCSLCGREHKFASFSSSVLPGSLDASVICSAVKTKINICKISNYPRSRLLKCKNFFLFTTQIFGSIVVKFEYPEQQKNFKSGFSIVTHPLN